MRVRSLAKSTYTQAHRHKHTFAQTPFSSSLIFRFNRIRACAIIHITFYFTSKYIWAEWVSALDFVANFHYLEFIFQAPVPPECGHKQSIEKKQMRFECENSGFGQIEIECCQVCMLVGLTSFKFSTGTIWAIASTRISSCTIVKTSKWHMHDLYATIQLAAVQQEPIFLLTNNPRFGNRCNTCAKCKNSNPFTRLVYWFLVCENRNSFFLNRVSPVWQQLHICKISYP